MAELLDKISEEARKKVKQGRIIIIILTVLLGIMALVEYNMYGEEPLILAIYAPFFFSFLAFSIFYYRSPYGISIAALSIYILLQVMAIIGSPENAAKGAFLKVVIIVGLVQAIKHARDYKIEKKKVMSDTLDGDMMA